MKLRGGAMDLMRFQLRLWVASSRQWLFSLGLMPDRDATALGYAYAFYALALALVWVGASWGALVHLTLAAGSALPAGAGTSLGHAVPALLGLGLAAMAAAALLGLQLHLSGPDIAHLGGARVSRRTLVLLRFLPSALVVTALALPLGTVLAVLATRSPRHYLLAMATLALLALGAYAGTWILGLLRLTIPGRLGRSILWLAPLGLLIGLFLRLPAVLWPGEVFGRAAFAGAVALPGLLAWALAPVLLMLLLAGFIDWTALLDQSLRRNLMRSIDAGRRWNPAIAAQQRRAAILSRRRPYLRLPVARAPWLLLGRGGLARLRYPPSLWGLLRTATVLLAGLNLAILPVRGDVWLLWLLAVFIYPPLALAEDYQSDTDPFWFQLLGIGPARLLLWDALLPEGIVIVLGLIELSLMHLGPLAALSAFLLLLGLLALATVSQAVSSARGGPLRRMPLPDVLPAAIGYALFALVGVAGHAVLTSAVLLLAYSLMLWRLLDQGA